MSRSSVSVVASAPVVERGRWWRWIAGLVIAAVVGVIGVVGVSHAAGTPTLITDRADYAPGAPP